MPPVNDNFADRILLTEDSTGRFSESGNNDDATLEVGEPSYGYYSVWYEYVPSKDGVLTLTCNGKSIGVYTGDSVGSLNAVFQGRNSINQIEVRSGASYKIAITGNTLIDHGVFVLDGTFSVFRYSTIVSSPWWLGESILSMATERTTGRIWAAITDQASPNPTKIYFSDDSGVHWSEEGKTFSQGAGYPKTTLYVDNSDNLIVLWYDGTDHLNIDRRIKSTGSWDSSISISYVFWTGREYQTCFDTNTDKLHIIWVKASPLSADNWGADQLFYCFYENGVLSDIFQVTDYSNIYTVYSPPTDWLSIYYAVWPHIVVVNGKLYVIFVYCNNYRASWSQPIYNVTKLVYSELLYSLGDWSIGPLNTIKILKPGTGLIDPTASTYFDSNLSTNLDHSYFHFYLDRSFYEVSDFVWNDTPFFTNPESGYPRGGTANVEMYENGDVAVYETIRISDDVSYAQVTRRISGSWGNPEIFAFTFYEGISIDTTIYSSDAEDLHFFWYGRFFKYAVPSQEYHAYAFLM